MHAPSASSTAAGAAAVSRDDLIVRHLPLVNTIAARLRYLAQISMTLEQADLVGFGVEGLIAAVDSYDPAHGTAFSTWAAYRIRGAILDRVRELDPVPRSLRDRRSAVDRARAELTARDGHPPADAAVAAHLGITITMLREVVAATSRRVVALDARDGDDRSGVVVVVDQSDRGDPEGVVEAIEQAAEVKQVASALLGLLPERERRVLHDHYLAGRRLPEIAAALGVTRARVSQLHMAGRRRLLARFAGATRASGAPRYAA